MTMSSVFHVLSDFNGCDGVCVVVFPHVVGNRLTVLMARVQIKHFSCRYIKSQNVGIVSASSL